MSKCLQDENKRYESNSFCVKYENDNFFIGLANTSDDDDDIDLKAYMVCDKEDFEKFFASVLMAIVDHDRATGASFIKDFFKEG